jgi:sorbitol-6-phosphate 2-dehydrogenase
VMISNAGVLKAGGIDETDPETLDYVTRVNYHGYYNCIKASVPVMRQQNLHNPGNYGDIIQINSKSGVVGSKKNFAYAGSKFAGIGMTHSLALDLMPERIKINAICPGNYFEGPLWSDPETGLFIQYLRTGKVPGASTIEDVKRHYESMVPAGRGCRIGDVVKAIRYVIDQEYETGQAIMVTGGQVMLS